MEQPGYITIQSKSDRKEWFNIYLYNDINSDIVNSSLITQSVNYKLDDKDWQTFTVPYNTYMRRLVLYGYQVTLGDYQAELDPNNFAYNIVDDNYGKFSATLSYEYEAYGDVFMDNLIGIEINEIDDMTAQELLGEIQSLRNELNEVKQSLTYSYVNINTINLYATKEYVNSLFNNSYNSNTNQNNNSYSYSYDNIINNEYKNLPLTLEILESGQISLCNEYPNDNTYISQISYTVNNVEYTDYSDSVKINVNTNDIITFSNNSLQYTYINSTAYFNIYGNINENKLIFKNCDKLLSAENLVNIYNNIPGGSWSSNLFYNCINLNKAPKQDYSNLYYTSPYMFYNCKKLETINHNKISASTHSFEGCELLDNINEVISECGFYEGNSIFKDCKKLKNINKVIISGQYGDSAGTNYGIDFYTLNQMFEGCTSLEIPPIIEYINERYSYVNISLSSMFRNCTSLKQTLDISNLNRGITSPRCQNMYEGCISLISTGNLPFTELINDCYNQMFKDCTSLINIPELNVELLTEGCYERMFIGCTSLINGPILKSKHLQKRCYSGMFSGCTNLTNITILSTDINKIYGFTNESEWIGQPNNQYKVRPMLDGIAETGTLYKDPTVDSSLFESIIPQGWTIEDYQEET